MISIALKTYISIYKSHISNPAYLCNDIKDTCIDYQTPTFRSVSIQKYGVHSVDGESNPDLMLWMHQC